MDYSKPTTSQFPTVKQGKRTYQRPQLTLYGQFQDLTQGGSAGTGENSPDCVLSPQKNRKC